MKRRDLLDAESIQNGKIENQILLNQKPKDNTQKAIGPVKAHIKLLFY